MRLKKKGFTLIEMLAVLAVIAVLMGLIIPAVGKMNQKAKETKARAEMQNIIAAVKNYEQMFGILPVPIDSASPTTPITTDRVWGYATGDDDSDKVNNYHRFFKLLTCLDTYVTVSSGTPNEGGTADSAAPPNVRNVSFLNIKPERNIRTLNGPLESIMNTNLEKEKTPSSTYPYRTDYTQLSYLDPWGEKYRVVLDYDYNGQIIVDSSAAGGINIPGENVKTGSNNDILYGSSVFVYCPSITAVGLPELTASKVNVLRSEKGKHDFLKSWKNVREPGLQ